MVSLNSAPIAPDFDRETGMPTQMVAGVPDVKNPSPRHGCSHSERQDNETGLGHQIVHSSAASIMLSPHTEPVGCPGDQGAQGGPGTAEQVSARAVRRDGSCRQVSLPTCPEVR